MLNTRLHQKAMGPSVPTDFKKQAKSDTEMEEGELVDSDDDQDAAKSAQPVTLTGASTVTFSSQKKKQIE